MANVDKLGPYIQQLMATAIESDDDFVKELIKCGEFLDMSYINNGENIYLFGNPEDLDIKILDLWDNEEVFKRLITEIGVKK